MVSKTRKHKQNKKHMKNKRKSIKNKKGGTVKLINFDKILNWTKLKTCPKSNCGPASAHFLGLIYKREDAEKLAATTAGKGFRTDTFLNEASRVTGIQQEYVRIYNRGYDLSLNLLKSILKPCQGVGLVLYLKKGCFPPAHFSVLYRLPTPPFHATTLKNFIMLDPQLKQYFDFENVLLGNVSHADVLIPKNRQYLKTKGTCIIFDEDARNIYNYLKPRILQSGGPCEKIGVPYGEPLNFEMADNTKEISIAVLKNCKALERWNKWLQTNRPLRNRFDIGCGLNSLYFLSYLSYEDVDFEFNKILKCPIGDPKRGTPMIQIVQEVNKRFKSMGITNLEAFEVINNFNKKQDIKYSFDVISNILPENSCTVVRFNRSGNTPGHTVIMTKQDNKLLTIDPQQLLLRPYKGNVSDNMVKKLNNAGFVTISSIAIRKIKPKVAAPTPTPAPASMPTMDIKKDDEDAGGAPGAPRTSSSSDSLDSLEFEVMGV